MMDFFRKLMGKPTLKQQLDAAYQKGLGSDFLDSFRSQGNQQQQEFFNFLSVEQQLSAMANSDIVFACVDLIAKSFLRAPIIMQRKTSRKGAWTNVTRHPDLDPFRSNPWLSMADIEEYIAQHLSLTGASYLWKWRDQLGQVKEIWPIPPDWVEPDLDDNPQDTTRVVRGWFVTPGRTNDEEIAPIYVPVEDMVYNWYKAPWSLWQPLSPLNAARKPLALEELGWNQKADTLSDLTSAIVAKTKEELTRSQKADLRAVLQQKLTRSVQDNVVILSGEGTELDALNPLQQFEWKHFSQLNETRICSVFHVPPLCVGLQVGLENSPWSNTTEAKRWFYQNTISAMWDQIARGLTRSFIAPEDQDRLRFSFDISEIQEMRDDIDARADRLRQLFDASILTRREVKEGLDIEANPEDDVFKVPLNMQVVPSDPSGDGEILFERPGQEQSSDESESDGDDSGDDSGIADDAADSASESADAAEPVGDEA